MPAADVARIFEAFYAAKRVIHYYWVHTDSDNLEEEELFPHNIKVIVEAMTGEKISVSEFSYDSQFHRAFVEKYRTAEGVEHRIYVNGNDPEEWQKVTVIKEICHVLVDNPQEFQSDPCKTIASVLDESAPFEENSKHEADSEALAEIVAKEIFYPIEHRRHDRQLLSDGMSISDVAISRKIPAKYVVDLTSDEQFNSAVRIWRLLPPAEPENLNEKI